jgi:hypothetical protein
MMNDDIIKTTDFFSANKNDKKREREKEATTMSD